MELRKPVFLENIDWLGKWYWIEVQGYEKMIRKQSGNFAFIENSIMGWNCKTLGDIWAKQKEVNFAPRYRMWEGDDPPTQQERDAEEWKDNCRVWMPDSKVLFDVINGKARYKEWKLTGRTVWKEE